MTPLMPSQRDMVRASLLAQSPRETRHDYYPRRRSRLQPDPISIREITRSIGELGELLTIASTEPERAWLALRLRNRLDALDAVEGR